jgi:hypothetical protein
MLRGKPTNRFLDLGDAADDHLVDQPLEQRPHRIEHPRTPHPIDEARRALDRDRRAGRERRPQRQSGIGLDGEDPAAGTAAPDRLGDAASEAAAADRDQHRLDVGQVLDDLLADRRGAGNHLALADGGGRRTSRPPRRRRRRRRRCRASPYVVSQRLFRLWCIEFESALHRDAHRVNGKRLPVANGFGVLYD